MSITTTPGTRRDCQCPRARHEHGTWVAYTHDRCRCEDCRQAMRDYHTAARRGRGSGYVDPTETVTHIRQLRADGWTCRQIGLAAGCTAETISRLCCDPPARILLHTAQAVLAIRPALTALGARRRIQALAVIGWRQQDIAAAAGVGRVPIQRVLGITPGACTTDTLARIQDLYDRAIRHGLTPAGGYSTIARRRALARGWVSPMRWGDIDHDLVPEPAAPDTGRRGPYYDEEILLGRSIVEIARLHQVKPDSVRVWLWRHTGRWAA